MKRGLVVLALALGLPAPAFAELVPHEAHYRIELESLNVGGTAIRAEGAMAVRATRDCQKWKVLKELLYVVETSDGTVIRLHTMDQVYEGLDGRRMEFAGWFKVNGGSRSSMKGHATLSPEGGRAIIREPEAGEWELAAGTRFPMAALGDLVDALAAGRSLPRYETFSGLGLSTTTSITPAKSGRLGDTVKGNVELLQGRSWLIQSSLFPNEKNRGKPLMTSSTQVHSNGVVSRFWTDLEIMSIRADIVSIEEFPRPDC